MTQAFLYRMSFLYLTLPVLIFFASWIRPLISIPFIILSVIIACFNWRNIKGNQEIPVKNLIISALVALAWCYLAGLGGFYYQSDDYHFRNAVLRDLITHEWPVYYPAFDGALVYYIGHWMVPALIGKAALLWGFSDSFAWHTAAVVLYLWTAIGIFLIFSYLYLFLAPKTLKAHIGIFGLCLFFSGMDAIGTFLYGTFSEHIEWWAVLFQYSSFTTCLFWVFNQTVAPWLIIMMVITQKRIQDWAVLGVFCFFYAPLPAIGLLPFLILWSGRKMLRYWRMHHLSAFIQKAFSIQNLIATFVCFPLFYLYLSINQTLSEEQNGLRFALTNGQEIRIYFIFFIL